MRQRILVISSQPADRFRPYAMPHQELTACPVGHVFIGWDGQKTFIETGRGESILDFDAVYMSGWYSDRSMSRFIALHLKERGIPFVFKDALVGRSKLSDMYWFLKAGIRYPKTAYALPSHVERLIRTMSSRIAFRFPLIVKHVSGWAGKFNYRVRSEAELAAVLTSIRGSLKEGFLIQEYIPNDSDYRIIVTDGEPTLIVKRMRADDSTHTNYISQGAKSIIYSKDEVPPALWQTAVAAAKAVNRDDCCGVDLVVHAETNECYLLEANEDPSMVDMSLELKIPPVFKYLDRRVSQRGS